MSFSSVGEIYKHIIDINSVLNTSEKNILLNKLSASPALGDTSHAITAVLMGMIYDCHTPSGHNKMPDNFDFKVISLKNSGRIFDFYNSWPLDKHVSIFEGTNARSQDFDIESERFYNSHIKGTLTASDLGHMGCTLSHYKLWDQSEIDEDGYLCVLEDDAILMPYAKNLFPHIAANIPSDADIVFINGRSSEKLYITSGNRPPYSFPVLDLFVKKTDLYRIMNNNYNFLPKGLGASSPLRHWSGTDGYILTNKGLDKLKKFINIRGIPPIAPRGAGSNIDCILSLLTASKSDIGTKSIGFNIKNKNALDLLDTTPYLMGYVTRYPLLDTRDSLGYSHQNRTLQALKTPTEDEIDMIRDAAFLMSKSEKSQSIALLELCHKYRPNGKVLKSRLDKLKSERIETAQICMKKHLMFVHIPKCGGTSIDNSGLFSHKVLGHRSYSKMIQMVEPYSHKYRVLVLCRNPWDRLASAFYYLSEGGCGNGIDMKYKEDLVGKFNGNFSLFLESFCEDPKSYLNCMHMRPSIKFIKPSTCANPLYIQKLEEISDPSGMFDFVGEQFKIRHDRKRKIYPAKRTYSDASFQQVREIYYEDCVEFGYLEYSLQNIRN